MSKVKRKYIILNTVGSGTWTVPTDWNNSSNIIHLIGGGGAGYVMGGGGAGGGGGGYNRLVNFNSTPGSSFAYVIGAGGVAAPVATAGGNTSFNQGGAVSAVAGGGGAGTQIAGTDTVGGTGLFAGGSSTSNLGGGGGAGGPFGAGLPGATGTVGGPGGNGLGGAGGDNANGSPGYDIMPGAVGSGGGGGKNFNGGLYGGGGAYGTSAGNGAQGVIVIEYTPLASFMSPDGDLEQIFIDDYATIDEYARTGSLWLWGRNNYGQLGDNTTINRSSPVQTISGGTNWKQVSAGSATVAIKTDGTLWTWGRGSLGQLGNNGVTPRSSPVQTIAGGTNWAKISENTSLCTGAIKTDGTLWLWGFGTSGQLGDNTINNRSSPVQTVAGGKNWKELSLGSWHSAAIKTDGTLWLWGKNNYGQLGDNTTVGRSSPVQTISGGTNWKQVSTSGFDGHTAAIKTDGTLWLWGFGTNGTLGNNGTTNISSPIQTISAGTNWKQVSAGSSYTGAIKTDGTLWLWGLNNYGQLGNNTITNTSSPIQTIASGTNWKKFKASYTRSSSAVKTDGTLWNWGANASGELGNNSTARFSSPVQTVAGGNNWKSPALSQDTNGAIHFYDAGNLYPSA